MRERNRSRPIPLATNGYLGSAGTLFLHQSEQDVNSWCVGGCRFTLAISRSMPMFMVLAWIYTVSMVVKGIVYEKELRLKEVMKTMGLGNGVHWLAWFITCFIMMTISVILLLVVLKVRPPAHYSSLYDIWCKMYHVAEVAHCLLCLTYVCLCIQGGRVLERTDPSVVFLFMLAFSVATIMQCFMFSVIFSKANLAAACAAIFYFIGYLPYAICVRWEEFMRTWQKAVAVSPNMLC